MAVLQHQRAQLEEEVQRLKEEINKQYETIQLAAREAENRLAEERRTREQLIQSEKAHVESLTKGLSECKLSTKQLQSQKEEHVTRIQSLQQQVSSAENEGNIHKCVVDDLRAQLVEAKRLISVGEERSRTFENRYRLGQLVFFVGIPIATEVHSRLLLSRRTKSSSSKRLESNLGPFTNGN